MKIVYIIQGGAGDVVAATPTIRGLKKTYPEDELIVLSTWAHMLYGNPHIDRLLSFQVEHEIREIFNQFIEPHKLDELRFVKDRFPYDAFFDYPRFNSKTLPEYICRVNNVEYDGKPPDYVITEFEKCAAKEWMMQFTKPVVLLHTQGVMSLKSIPSKTMQKFIRSYSNEFDFVQIGAANDPPIENTHNALGMPMRDTCSILPLAKHRILIDSVFAHVSAALRLKSIVAFHATDPKFFGYENHINISNSNCQCPLWPCNRPVGSIHKFMPGYKNLKTGGVMHWHCANQTCVVDSETLDAGFDLAACEEKKIPNLEDARKS